MGILWELHKEPPFVWPWLKEGQLRESTECVPLPGKAHFFQGESSLGVTELEKSPPRKLPAFAGLHKFPRHAEGIYKREQEKSASRAR